MRSVALNVRILLLSCQIRLLLDQHDGYFVGELHYRNCLSRSVFSLTRPMAVSVSQRKSIYCMDHNAGMPFLYRHSNIVVMHIKRCASFPGE